MVGTPVGDVVDAVGNIVAVHEQLDLQVWSEFLNTRMVTHALGKYTQAIILAHIK